jgi:hypothetical protein
MVFRPLHRRTSSTTHHAQPTSSPTTTTTTATTTPTKPSPLLTLPTELYHQIASYLPAQSAACLSLTSRTALYALGTGHLARAVDESPNAFAKREVLEHTLERAFPSSWFCAWCTGFHAWSAADGPSATGSEGDGDAAKCIAYNGAISFPGYVLRYHHVRLALHAAAHGAAHGIALRAFDASTTGTALVFRSPVRAKTVHAARIVDAALLLHTTHSLLLPAWIARHKGALDAVWAALPRALVAHRGCGGGGGHDGLMAVLDNVLRRGWRYPYAQACGGCRTEFAVSCYEFAGGYVQLRIRTWRDLGRGESPFEGAWRAHCEGRGSGERNSGVEGDIRKAFESADGGGKDEEARRDGGAKGVLLALKRRRLNGIARDEIRRSRVVSWRTTAENDDVCRREEERRCDEARVAAENAARLEAELMQ